ncbi:cytochrome c biogenesis protein ResB [Peptococcus niger]|uniref:Cytochrome c biogenesis protein n=1 Tax=Peptococcus niger TaxID=2741 RepID=A0A1G6TJA7_PEPNI|nr:cytochrome c biogenesis protein ResB [Peptococcus niger]SDD28944.1 cytochrome c biogenesis protein [Peptococcus niger]
MKRTILSRLLNMKVAIGFLLVLSAIAALGTFIAQEQSAEFYTFHYGNRIGHFLMTTGLTDIYHSPWFIFLGILLCVYLVLCSLMRLRGRKNRRLIGSVILHLSLVLLVAGALLNMATGATEDVSLVRGETAKLTEGALAGTTVQVDKFTIDWYDNGSASQYITDLAFTDRKGKRTKEQISVNHPYRHGFIKIYQEKYGWEVHGKVSSLDGTKKYALREGQDFPLKEGQSLAQIFVPNYDVESRSLKSVTAAPKNPYLAVALQANGQPVDMRLLQKNGKSMIGNLQISFDDYVPYTGLRVKYDCGIPVVFVSFILALAGLFLRYMDEIRLKKGDRHG